VVFTTTQRQDRVITSDDLISKKVARPRLFNWIHLLTAALDLPGCLDYFHTQAM
jgi:hypothetical protein